MIISLSAVSDHQSQSHGYGSTINVIVLRMPIILKMLISALMTWSAVIALAVIRVSQEVCQRSEIRIIIQSAMRLFPA
eukprot:3979505-Amphidinium_carterae.1